MTITQGRRKKIIAQDGMRSVGWNAHPGVMVGAKKGENDYITVSGRDGSLITVSFSEDELRRIAERYEEKKYREREEEVGATKLVRFPMEEK